MSNRDEIYLKFAHELADSVQDEIKSHFRKTSNWKIKPTKNNKRPQIATEADLNAPRNTNSSAMNPLKPGKPSEAKKAIPTKAVYFGN